MKKGIPMYLLKQIQPIIDRHRNLITVTPLGLINGDWLMELLDIEQESGFYFRVKDNVHPDKFDVSWAPVNGYSTRANESSYELNGVVQRLAEWTSILNDYASTPDIFDDPILRSYEAEFAEYFTVQEEDADEAPLDLPRQLYLSEYLSRAMALVEQQVEEATPRQKVELILIAEECVALEKDMGRLTKNQTARKLAGIMAKARKFGIGLVKEFIAEFKKEGFKQIAKAILDVDLPAIGDVLGSIGPGVH